MTSGLTEDFMTVCRKDSVYTCLFSLIEKAYSQPQNNYFCVLLILGFIWLFISFRPCENANIINVFQLELAPRKNTFYLGNCGSLHALVIKRRRKHLQFTQLTSMECYSSKVQEEVSLQYPKSFITPIPSAARNLPASLVDSCNYLI